MNMQKELIYFKYWYPLPTELPDEIQLNIYLYMFNPMEDPW